EDLCRAALAAVLDLTGFDSGALWTLDVGAGPVGGGTVTVAARRGPVADVLVGMPDAQVHQLRELVTDLTSCYSGGTDLSLAVPPMHTLRERGIRGVLVVPVRDGWNLTGVLTVVSTSSAYVAPESVDAIEALVLQAGSRLAALRRVAELSGVAAHVHQLLAPRAAGAPWGPGGRRLQGSRDVPPARPTPA
ncbi:GAF domain-containing protein, partial [Cellulomonas bogoriensis]|uniref:GAF domain-containing protein n=1 Tax=Cellulomonas bogoriensis TaxID=301388 RepID=UPI00054D3880